MFVKVLFDLISGLRITSRLIIILKDIQCHLDMLHQSYDFGRRLLDFLFLKNHHSFVFFQILILFLLKGAEL